jgi:hypothetical protein
LVETPGTSDGGGALRGVLGGTESGVVAGVSKGAVTLLSDGSPPCRPGPANVQTRPATTSSSAQAATLIGKAGRRRRSSPGAAPAPAPAPVAAPSTKSVVRQTN